MSEHAVSDNRAPWDESESRHSQRISEKYLPEGVTLHDLFMPPPEYVAGLLHPFRCS